MSGHIEHLIKNHKSEITSKDIPQLMNELNISTEDMSNMADGKTIFLSNVDAEDLAKVGALYKLSGVDRVNVSLFIGDHDEHKVIVTEGKDDKAAGRNPESRV